MVCLKLYSINLERLQIKRPKAILVLKKITEMIVHSKHQPISTGIIYLRREICRKAFNFICSSKCKLLINPWTNENISLAMVVE